MRKGLYLSEWEKIGFLNESDVNFKDYNKNIGIYKAIYEGVIVYIGKATELNNGGFRKRLRDYTRESDSARNYPSGQKMYENRNNIIIEIFIVENSEGGVERANELEIEFISQFNPKWNLLDN